MECAATAEGGFARDEPYDALGHAMLLPPWFEERRDEIMAMLEPITIPENNFPTHLEAVHVNRCHSRWNTFCRGCSWHWAVPAPGRIYRRREYAEEVSPSPQRV